MSSRTIIHVDLDAFYCSVEEKRDPSLRGKAFAVGGSAEGRGVVASCSYQARAHGVRSAMSAATALRLCPPLIMLPVRMAAYREASHQVMDILRGYTELLEQISVDEAFLDVTALIGKFEPGAREDAARDLALDIQLRIQEELGLSCSVGVASNKMVAKIATDFGKAAMRGGNTPHALCLVPPGEEESFLAPLSVTALWGVGPKMAERLNTLRIGTIGQLAQWPERDLVRRFGKHGHELAQHARGIDKREIVTERESKSISSETTFARDVQDWEQLRETLVEQAESVARQLNGQGLSGTTIKVKVRWTDFSITSRQLTLTQATTHLAVIVEVAVGLLATLWASEAEAPIRLLGVGIGGLSPARQLGLFDDPVSENSAGEELVVDESAHDGPAHEEPAHQESSGAESASMPSAAESARREERQAQLRDAIQLLEARFGAQVVRVGSRLPPCED